MSHKNQYFFRYGFSERFMPDSIRPLAYARNDDLPTPLQAKDCKRLTNSDLAAS
jgi:hypothetical protein